MLDVAFRHVRPMADWRDLVLLVVPNGVARVRVPLDHRAMAHIVGGKPERQPARAREQLDRFEGARRQHQRWILKRGGERLFVHGFENVGLNRCDSGRARHGGGFRQVERRGLCERAVGWRGAATAGRRCQRP